MGTLVGATEDNNHLRCGSIVDAVGLHDSLGADGVELLSRERSWVAHVGGGSLVVRLHAQTVLVPK